MIYTLPFQRLSKNDIPLAGGKGANLGELAQSDIPVPPGFVITTQAYKDFVAANQLQAQIMTLAAPPLGGVTRASLFPRDFTHLRKKLAVWLWNEGSAKVA